MLRRPRASCNHFFFQFRRENENRFHCKRAFTCREDDIFFFFMFATARREISLDNALTSIYYYQREGEKKKNICAELRC